MIDSFAVKSCGGRCLRNDHAMAGAIRLTSHGLVIALANFIENTDSHTHRGSEFILKDEDLGKLGAKRVLNPIRVREKEERERVRREAQLRPRSTTANCEDEGVTYTSVFPRTLGELPFAVAMCVTTANGSLLPLPKPATFFSPTACKESSTFMVFRSEIDFCLAFLACLVSNLLLLLRSFDAIGSFGNPDS